MGKAKIQLRVSNSFSHESCLMCSDICAGSGIDVMIKVSDDKRYYYICSECQGKLQKMKGSNLDELCSVEGSKILKNYAALLRDRVAVIEHIAVTGFVLPATTEWDID